MTDGGKAMAVTFTVEDPDIVADGGHGGDRVGHALAYYSEAIRLNPKYALAFRNRGNAWQAQENVVAAAPRELLETCGSRS
jgi:hypothetical protein